MAIFTVHVPPGAADPRRRAERIVVVREGFSWAAFWLGPLALAYRRLWLAALIWLGIAALIASGAYLIGLPAAGTMLLFFLLALLTGLEARMLRQHSLTHRGYEFAALLAGRTVDEAETAFFRGDAPKPTPNGPARPPAATSPEVIGSFPQVGGT